MGNDTTGTNQSVEGYDLALQTHKVSSGYGKQTSSFFENEIYHNASANGSSYNGTFDGIRGDGSYNVGHNMNSIPLAYDATEMGLIDYIGNGQSMPVPTAVACNTLGAPGLGGQ